MTTQPYRQYQTAQVQTASQGQLLLMCYDGALRFLAQAREAMLGRRYEVQSRAIGKVQGLLTELTNGLDHERGGDIAGNLEALYGYLFDRLTEANIHDDLAALDEVQASLSDLRAAWREAVAQTGGTPADARPREWAVAA